MTNELANAYLDVGYAIIEQAVADFQALQERGIIDEECNVKDFKPNLNQSIFIDHYRNKSRVQTLVSFLRDGDCERMLTSLGSKISYDAIASRLRLK
jgi:hypothetical protein